MRMMEIEFRTTHVFVFASQTQAHLIHRLCGPQRRERMFGQLVKSGWRGCVKLKKFNLQKRVREKEEGLERTFRL